MSTEEALINKMEKLQETLERVQEMANIILGDSVELGGEWEQEISADLMDFTGRLNEIFEEYSNLVEEAKTIREGSAEEEESYDDTDEE
jgi:hypothetical protein